MNLADADLHPIVLSVLEPDEELHSTARARDALIALTDRRLIVADGDRIALKVDIDNIRRIQFDIERQRPATLVIVPDRPEDEPQVLAIEPSEYERAGRTLAIIGLRLAGANTATRS